jgi:hypothetical protein
VVARESTAHETTTDSELGLDTAQLTYASFYRVFTQSVRQYNQGIGTNNPDLSAFRMAGGKLLSWHGQADQLVLTKSAIAYRNRVDALVAGNGCSCCRVCSTAVAAPARRLSTGWVRS